MLQKFHIEGVLSASIISRDWGASDNAQKF